MARLKKSIVFFFIGVNCASFKQLRNKSTTVILFSNCDFFSFHCKVELLLVSVAMEVLS